MEENSIETYYSLEVGIASAILSEILSESLKKEEAKKEKVIIHTYEAIAYHAMDFLSIHRKQKTDWMEVREKGLKPLSKKYTLIYNWDDAVRDYGHYVLELPPCKL